MERNRTQNYPELKAVLENSNLPEVIRDNLKLVLEEKLRVISRDYNFSMLDVGTSDGEMSLPLAQWLKGNFDNFIYTALEPEGPAFEKLNARIKTQGIDYAKSSNLTIEKYLEAKKGEEDLFDFILFSHVFYHIPREKWADVIAGSQRLLRPNGFILVVLDSSEGKAYELADLITENKTRADTLEFGNLYYAEDMEDFLTKNGVKHVVKSFATNIFIQEDGRELHNFARVLAFLYRTFPERILANHKGDLEKSLEKTKRGNRYVLEDIAKVITFGKD